MPNLAEKEKKVMALRQKVEAVNAALLIDYKGLPVKEMTTLRRQIRESGGELQVVKNTLFRRAVQGTPLQLDPFLVGPTAVVFVQSDAVAVVKALSEFMRDHRSMALKGGFLEGQVYGAEQLGALAQMPTKAELQAQVVGALAGVLAGYVGVLRAVLAQYVFTLQAIAEQRRAQGEPIGEESDMATTEELIEQIGKMTVFQLVELTKGLQERFGVSAAVPVAAAAPAPGAAAPAEAAAPPEEKTTFDVILASVGDKKIQVIKAIRELTNLGLADAKAFVESAPKVVKEGVSKEEAEKIRAKLEEQGATVEIK